MKIIHVIDYPKLLCNAPGGCKNDGVHLVTLQPDESVHRYRTYRVCNGHLKVMQQHATNTGS